jgi:hypothetical protein
MPDDCFHQHQLEQKKVVQAVGLYYLLIILARSYSYLIQSVAGLREQM